MTIGNRGRSDSALPNSLASAAVSDVTTKATLLRDDLKARSLISMRGYSPAEIALLLEAAEELKSMKRRGEYGHHLANRNVALILLKPSLRTRISFSTAAADEGAHLEVLSGEDIRFGAKESVRDIARVLGRIYDGIAFRGFGEEILETLVELSGVPVWNALSDSYHPTQVLADLLTIKESFGHLDGIAVTYVGDGRNNQARSLAIGAAKTGLDFRILAPPQLQPPAGEVEAILAEDDRGRITVTDDPGAALGGSAVVYGDVWVSMGEEALIDERIRQLRGYKVTPEMLALTGRDDTIYLHCLPALHNTETEFARRFPDVLEVSEEVFEGARSRVFDQAENRMHTIKALMVLSLP